MGVHETAVLSKQTEIGKNVEIGPYVVTRGEVILSEGTRVDAHAVVGSEFGSIKMGKNNHVHSGAVIGGPPQDLKFAGEKTFLEIGDNNVFREFVTINVGTVTGGGLTKIGSHCLLMAYVHVAHDCTLGDHVVIANTSNFAGHVTVEDHVRIGGVCSFNQFITLGEYCYIAGDSAVNKDILPYTIAQGKYAVVRATNKIGLERAGFSKEDIESIHKAVRLLTKGSRTIDEAIQTIEAECKPSERLSHLVNFVKTSERGIAK